MSKDAPETARITLVIDLALFLSGVVTGWLIYPAPLFPPEKPAVHRSADRDAGQFRSAKQLSSTLHALMRTEDPRKLAEEVDQLPTREIPSLIVLLTERSSFNGLPQDHWRILRALLESWHTRDSDRAIAWALSWETPATRLPLMQILMEAEAAVDPVRAISLSHEHLIDEEGTLTFPDSAYEEALRRGQDTYLVCLKQSVHSSGVLRTQVMDFPEDFDFPGFAEQLGTHVRALPDDLHQAMIPGNLPDEWAKLDPAAAFTWTLQNPGAVSRGALHRMAELIAHAPPPEVSSFLHQLREAGDTSPRDIHRAVIAVLNVQPNPEIFAQYLGSFDTPDARLVQMLGLFRQSLHRTRRPERRIQRLILERIPANERSPFLLEIAAQRDADGETNPLSHRVVDGLRRELASLGHKPDTIDSMLTHF